MTSPESSKPGPDTDHATTAGSYYVFGIVPEDVVLPDDLQGLDGLRPDILTGGRLAAVVQPVDPSRYLGTRADLLAHSAVLDRLAQVGPVIPMHFGTVLDGAAAVTDDLLEAESDRFQGILAQLAGTGQFNLSVTYAEDLVLAEVVEENPEIADLRQRTRDQPDDATYALRVRLGELVSRAVDAKREVDADRVLDTLVPFAAAHSVREGGGLQHVVDVAFLITDDRRSDFEAAAEDLAAVMTPRARLRLFGPLAPYDFVAEE